MAEPVINIEDLTVEYRIGHTWLEAVKNIDLAINPLQIHGLVGESGSGKSTLGTAMIRYLAANARIAGGRIHFAERDLRQVSARDMARIWGNQIGVVPQNTMDSLNPSLRIVKQMTEATQKHLDITAQEAKQRATDALRSVQIADPEGVLTRYPHQLSGGMLQRVMIAMALSTRPKLVLLDEPTTALDVTTQAVILDLLRDLIKEEQAAALYVSHDLGTVAQLCDYVTVLYAGEVMESAPVKTLFAQPRHPYTIGLLACLPSSVAGNESRLTTIKGVAPALGARNHACVFAERCPLVIDQCRQEKPPLEKIDASRTVRCWRWQEIADGSVTPFSEPQVQERKTTPKRSRVLSAKGMSKRFGDSNLLNFVRRKPPSYVQALRDVSINVQSRSTFGLVGESGSGKTTLARSILALFTADEGQLTLQDQPISLTLRQRDQSVLRNLRIVFQNPDDSLNPYRSVGETIDRTIQKLSAEKLSRSAIREQTMELLKAVGLSAAYYQRRPSQLSGGEKQRVVVARAFASHPALIVADEPTSSLDVSVQAVILNLLKDLRAQEGASYIVISHDLEVVSYLADHIAVMYLGEIIEQGSNDAIVNFPSHPYTEALLSAAPTPDPAVRQQPIALRGEIPSPRNRPAGCPFHTRCPRKIGAICEDELPPVRTDESGHEIRCHYSFEELLEQQNHAPPTPPPTPPLTPQEESQA